MGSAEDSLQVKCGHLGHFLSSRRPLAAAIEGGSNSYAVQLFARAFKVIEVCERKYSANSKRTQTTPNQRRRFWFVSRPSPPRN